MSISTITTVRSTWRVALWKYR